jgi:hypothetical protein
MASKQVGSTIVRNGKKRRGNYLLDFIAITVGTSTNASFNMAGQKSQI